MATEVIACIGDVLAAPTPQLPGGVDAARRRHFFLPVKEECSSNRRHVFGVPVSLTVDDAYGRPLTEVARALDVSRKGAHLTGFTSNLHQGD
jgi:hypothetical protein